MLLFIISMAKKDFMHTMNVDFACERNLLTQLPRQTLLETCCVDACLDENFFLFTTPESHTFGLKLYLEH